MSSGPIAIASPSEVPQTFGRARRSRETRRALSILLVAAVPVIGTAALAERVISGYHEHRASASGATSSAVVAPLVTVTPATEPHAPTGPDVGLDGLTAPMSRALTRARQAAATQGVTIDVVSGYRTRATQQRLFDDAVARYGSAKEASRWVLPPSKSAHVDGAAVDVGPAAGAEWLDRNGVRFGLCRRYVNEPWHFELLASAKGQRCPPMEADASG